ncbi:MAG TPA: TerC family protein [Phycisphaerales bacterium]|nr:TerC family protein [Phycisphaerales bacterium]
MMLATLAHAAAGGHGIGPVELFSWGGLAALATLTLLEVVLGIDNVVFLAILTNKLDPKQQKLARRIGLGLALAARVLLLLAIGWLMTLTKPLFAILGHEFSGKDLILLFGGLFLLTKATIEIYHNVEGDQHHGALQKRAYASFGIVVAQIVMMDVIFSLDSVITAVGMTQNIPIMIVAVMIAIGIMLAFAGPISNFIEKHPSLKILALAFLVLIGVLLAADGLGQHMPRGYVYAAMAFSVFVELLQMRQGNKKQAGKDLAGPASPDA